MLHCPDVFCVDPSRAEKDVSVTSTVRVFAPGRLHMGFLDLNGSLGRRFGSVGLTLEGIGIRLSVQHAQELTVDGPQARRARYFAQDFLDKLGCEGGAHVEIHDAIPEHVGLGSGTQMALAVGVALSELFGRRRSVREIAALHARGQRSGIGVGAFESGGFVVDGGRGTDAAPPPTVMRLDFPDDWRVLLILEDAGSGLHGEQEVAAFQALPPLSEALCAHLCRLLLMQTAPALAERNLDGFGRGITALQRIIGDHFAPAQGGRYASTRVAQALHWFEGAGVTGIGQSSWGPTGFAIVASEAQAQSLVREATTLWPANGGLAFRVLQGRNKGAQVVTT